MFFINSLLSALPCEGRCVFLSFITILTLYIFVSKQTQDEETDQTSALDGGV